MSDAATAVVQTNQSTETKAQEPAAAAPPKPEAPKPDDLSSRFNALAKKERAARLATQSLKAKEAQILERERQIAERERLWNEEFKQSPLEAIKKRGYSYEDLTKAALNDGKFDPATEIKSVREELAQARKEQEEKEKKAQEAYQKQQLQAEQEAVDAFKGRIAESLEQNKEKWELCNLYDAQDLVFQTVEEHFNRTKKVLSVDEACDLVESYLESEIERTAKESKKFQTKFGAPKQTKEEPGNPKSSVTLSNTLPSSASASLLPAHTEMDRMKRALARLG